MSRKGNAVEQDLQKWNAYIANYSRHGMHKWAADGASLEQLFLLSLCQRGSIWMNALVAWLTSARIQAELCAALNPGGLVLGGAKQHCRSVLPATVSTCTCSFAHSSISKLLCSRYIQLKISPRLSLQHCQQLCPARTDKTRLRLLASIQ